MNVLQLRGVVRIFLAVAMLGIAVKADEIHTAARAGDMDRVRAIVESDPDAVNARNGSGQTPLFDALLGNRPKIAEYLLSKGADVNARNSFQMTPLHFACGNGLSLNVLKLLVGKGAEVNAVAKYVGRPLDLAYESGDVANIEFMIASGASPTPMNFETFRLTENLRRIAFPWGMRNNIVVFHGPEGILLVDSGFSKRAIEAIRKTVAGFAKGDIRYVINTHSNMDHVAGNGIAPDPSAVIGYGKLVNGELRELAPRAAGKLTGRTGRTLDAPYIIKMNGEDIALIPNPGLHSQDDMIVHFPKAGYAVMGDLLLSQNCPAVRNPDAYLDFLDVVLDVFPVRTVFVSGHGRDLTHAELRKYRNVVAAMTAIVRKNATEGTSAENMIKADVLRAYKAEYSFLDWLGPDAWIARVCENLKNAGAK